MTKDELAMNRINELAKSLEECGGVVQRIVVLRMMEMYAREHEQIVIPDDELGNITPRTVISVMDDIFDTISIPEYFSYDVSVCWGSYSLKIYSVDRDYLLAE